MLLDLGTTARFISSALFYIPVGVMMVVNWNCAQCVLSLSLSLLQHTQTLFYCCCVTDCLPQLCPLVPAMPLLVITLCITSEHSLIERIANYFKASSKDMKSISAEGLQQL